MPSKVQYGISNVHYAVMNDDGTYGKPVHMPGADNLAISNTGGDNNIIYKDNKNYWSRSNSSGKQGELVMAKFPESFYTDILGQTKETGGGFSEGPSDIAKNFALLFQLEGDQGGRRVVWFNCTATTPTFTAATATDSITEATESSTITATSATINGVEKTQYSCEAGEKNYDGFFNAVPLTTAGE